MIRSLRVKNFRRYKDELFTFDEGVNFVEGENNAGKTSLFYAVEYALFGNVSVLRSPQALMHPGERGMGVELVFVGRDGNQYRLQRVHQMPPRSKTKVEGHFTLKQMVGGNDGEKSERYLLSSDFQDHEEALALKLQEVLGLSKRAFELAVHIRQGEITSILQGDPKLDIVLGVTSAVVANEELRAMALEAEKESSSLPVLEASLERAEQELARVGEDLEQLGKRAATLSSERQVLEQAERRLLDFASVRKPFVDGVAEARLAQKSWEDSQRRLREDNERLSDKMAKVGTREAIRGKVSACSRTMEELEGSSKEQGGVIKGLQEERRALDGQRGDLAGRIARREKLPRGQGARCEACGQLIDQAHSAAELDEWCAELARIDQALAARADAISQVEKKAESLDKDRREKTAEKTSLSRSLEELEELETAIDGKRKSVVEAAELLANALQVAVSSLAHARASSEKLLSPHDPLVALQVQKDLVADDLSQEQVLSSMEQEVQRLEDAHKEASIESKMELKTRREAEERALSELRERQDSIAEMEREKARLGTEITRLRRLRDRSAKLRVLAQAFKDLQVELREKASLKLAADTLELHQKLSSEDPEFFSLSIDPTRYAVNVTPKDVGQEVPAFAYQGGGHKLLLGLSFKLAVARMVGPCPFLLLDEPTYGLDVARRKSLLHRVEDLKVARQMLLITHQRVGDVKGRKIEVIRQGKTSTHREVGDNEGSTQGDASDKEDGS